MIAQLAFLLNRNVDYFIHKSGQSTSVVPSQCDSTDALCSFVRLAF